MIKMMPSELRQLGSAGHSRFMLVPKKRARDSPFLLSFLYFILFYFNFFLQLATVSIMSAHCFIGQDRCPTSLITQIQHFPEMAI